MEKLVLIDGNSLINRAFYAMPLLSAKDGTYTNAVYGFMNMFFKMLDSDKPKYVAVAFDVHAPTFRHKMYDGYKGTRKPSPPELPPQISLLKELLKEMGIKVIEQAGIEADDIIGTIAKATKVQTIIYTGDKDSFQLVDSETEVHFTKRGITDVDILTDQNFVEKVGYKPYQVIEYKALRGDTSDNIPGVSGIGEKTATELVQKYGDIQNIYDNIEDFSGKLKERLILDKEMAFFSKQLATIKTDCDIDTDLNNMIVNLPFSSSAKRRFVELEFKSLIGRDDLFISDGDNKGQKTQEICQVINVGELKEIADIVPLSIFDGDEYFCIYDGNAEYKLHIRQNLLDDGFSFSEIIGAYKDNLEKQENNLYYDKKSFLKKVHEIGYELKIKGDDLSIIKYLADFSGGAETLNDVILSYGYNKDTPAYSMYLTKEKLYKKLVEEGEEKLYRDVELPLLEVLYDMEITGFKIDINALYSEGDKFRKVLSDLEKKIRELTGEPTLNVNSPKQLGEVLFEKLKIGKGKKTKTGYSTSQEVLTELENTHPVIALILEYRGYQKLLSTYIDGFKPLIDKTTGLINTIFNQTVTSTGRLSSKEPNLQNIPVRDDLGKNLRKFFVPRNSDGYLVTADYSQIELRLLASFSNTQSLIKAFLDGKDIHTATASKVFKVKESDVTADMRRKAKAVNFGIIYGISEYGLAKNINSTPREAKDYIDSYFKEYPEVKQYMDSNVSFAKQTGYAKTMLNRRRYIREINSPNFQLRSFGERAAMNMPLQGSAADVIKVAMINVYNRLNREGLKSKLILQIHDELIVDTVKDELEKVKTILKEEMESAVNLKVKLTVGMGYGKTWYEAK